ncbi:hypothetical protein [Actinomyces vulturis]|uniref:hypothetical protein n=1 Tax=Actinomyces vulturis TaxID=1857645 RepID=UPI00083693DB|nr:hypothetical protein [Actinomyces vulturis]
MKPLITATKIIDIAQGSGLSLQRCDKDNANLYIWASQDDTALYIGKANSPKRIEDEERWSKEDYDNNVYSTIVTLLGVNKAKIIPLRYDPSTSDFSPIFDCIKREGWHGSYFERLTEFLETSIPTVEEVEKILIRIVLRCGCLIGNSQFASQWEGPLGRFSDTFAILAVDQAGILQSTDEITEDLPNEIPPKLVK